MPAMSRVERALCQSAPWRFFAARVVLPWALQRARPERRVLEIGGGSGAMAAALLQQYPQVSLTVTDVDPAMVDTARRRLTAFGPRAEVRQADATALPFDDGSFETVVTFIMLHHVGAWEQALREASRVLAPGGTLVGYDLLATPPMRVLHHLEGAPHRFIPRTELNSLLRSLPSTTSRYGATWAVSSPGSRRGGSPHESDRSTGAGDRTQRGAGLGDHSNCCPPWSGPVTTGRTASVIQRGAHQVDAGSSSPA